MIFEKYNKQLNPCHRCGSSAVEIVKNENAIGAACSDCGLFFASEDKESLAEIVEYWNAHYGKDIEKD